MGRITDIIDEAREIIADQDSSRYTDAALMRYLNRGLSRINDIAKVLKAKSYIKLEINTALYDMSSLALEIERIQYLEKNLEIKTEIQLDSLDSDWPNTTGTEVKYVTMDKTKSGVFKVYPKVTENALNNITQNQVYGCIIDIDVTDNLFEVPTDNITAYTDKYLTVYYVKKPDKVLISTIDDDLEFDDSLDTALIFYIAGRALRSDGDSQNRTFGAEQLGLFDTHLAEIESRQNHDNNKLDYREIAYKGFI